MRGMGLTDLLRKGAKRYEDYKASAKQAEYDRLNTNYSRMQEREKELKRKLIYKRQEDKVRKMERQLNPPPKKSRQTDFFFGGGVGGGYRSAPRHKKRKATRVVYVKRKPARRRQQRETRDFAWLDF